MTATEMLAVAAAAAAAAKAAAKSALATVDSIDTSAMYVASASRAACFARMRAIDACDSASEISAWADALAASIDKASCSPDAVEALDSFLSSPASTSWHARMMCCADNAVRAAADAAGWADAAADRAARAAAV